MESKPLRFELRRKSSRCNARLGVVHTAHATIPTPVFMPVGTLGAVKGLDVQDMQQLGARIMLSNAYHLMLRPGSKLVQKMGGLRRFTGYDGAFLTDSGGFQVFSLAKMRKITDNGVTFRSHIDGALIDLTPEKLVQTQEELGPDIAMVLDECPPGNAPREVVEHALRRTTAWAERCLAARTRRDMAWFGIVQGALHEDLRARHAEQISAMPFDGFAIGGVSVGEPPEDIERIVRTTAPLLPQDQPRYLMGVGTPEDLVRGVAAGIDMFDCVMPSRNARNGTLFTSQGKLSIKNAVWRDSDLPIDPACGCFTCRSYSRAFLRHLYMTGELTYFRLATLHNIAFYLQLMETMRARLADDTFDADVLLSQLRGEAIAA